MSKQLRDPEAEAKVRQILSQWELYHNDDTISVRHIKDDTAVWIGYCGKCDLVPFTPAMWTAPEPPHMLQLNIISGVLYILFIQVEKEFRGLGHGEALYDLVIEIARATGCHRVQQTPSGGYKIQDRYTYLLKRGWLPTGDCEVYKPVESDVPTRPTAEVHRQES